MHLQLFFQLIFNVYKITFILDNMYCSYILYSEIIIIISYYNFTRSRHLKFFNYLRNPMIQVDMSLLILNTKLPGFVALRLPPRTSCQEPQRFAAGVRQYYPPASSKNHEHCSRSEGFSGEPALSSQGIQVPFVTLVWPQSIHFAFRIWLRTSFAAYSPNVGLGGC